MTGRWTLALAAVIGLLVGAGAMAWYGGVFADSGRARIENVVHAYLLDHPEVLTEAMARLQTREAGQQVAANHDALTRPFAGAWSGNPRGDVTVVEFFDYNCGYCRASLPAIRQLVAADPKVRIVYRELPILSQESRVAAQVSLAAALQGKYAAFHDALYAAGPVSTASIAAAGKQAGISPPTPEMTKKADAEIESNLHAAADLGIQGTPSWIIGGQLLAGAQTLESLQEAVATARKAR